MNENNELELTDEQLERNDEIDNAVYNCILVLAEQSDTELPWDMGMVAEVTDAIKEALWLYGNIKVRHPGIVTDEDGNQSYQEYDYPEPDSAYGFTEPNANA